MFNFKYEIKTNKSGRPYVEICQDQTDHPEHKFMALEITRYLLSELLKDSETYQEMSEGDIIEIAKAGHLLEQISDKIAYMISEQNNALDDLDITVQDDE
jgi:hypothetical protein